MKNPKKVKTFRIRGLIQARETIESLVNHRQWFTFRPLMDANYPDDFYDLDLDFETPESGYNFKPTSDLKLFNESYGYGLRIY